MPISQPQLADWLERALSREQKEPFLRDSQNASILAGAGSGKTRTLTHLLVAELVGGVPPEQIIAFTFTEKAAGELLARVYSLARRLLPEMSLDGIFVGTIHAWCLQYCLQQPDYFGFAGIDELHGEALVSRFYDHLELERIYGRAFPQAVQPFLKDMEVFFIGE